MQYAYKILRFTFRSVWHFIGVVILIDCLFEGLALVVNAFK